MVPPVCNTMRTYTIRPLDFSGDQDCDLFCDSLAETINIHPTGSGWSVRTAPIEMDGYCLVASDPPYPTFEAAVEAANEIHRKAVEKFLEPACNPQRKRSSWVTPEHGTDSQ